MKKKKIFTYSILVVLIIIIHSCEKDDEVVNFQWFENGKRFYYDLTTDSGFCENCKFIEITNNRFVEHHPHNAYSNVGLFRLSDNEIEIKKDGLYGLDCVQDCSFDFFGCTEKFSYLIVPLSPNVNDVIPEMFCGKKISRSRKVINVSHRLSIKNINYNCTVIKDEWGYIEYW